MKRDPMEFPAFMKNGVWISIVLFLFTLELPAKVYTPRSGPGEISSPESYGARTIYGGQFRINGLPARMKVISVNAPSQEAFRRIFPDPDSVSNLKYKATPQGTIIGSLGKEKGEKRFLITPVGSVRSCLLFLLEGSEYLAFPNRTDIPWPKSLPILDVAQEPELVVEHLDSQFIFACIRIPGSIPETTAVQVRETLIQNGWMVEKMSEGMAADLAESGFAVLEKNGRICWLEARTGQQPNQVIVTLLCKQS